MEHPLPGRSGQDARCQHNAGRSVDRGRSSRGEASAGLGKATRHEGGCGAPPPISANGGPLASAAGELSQVTFTDAVTLGLAGATFALAIFTFLMARATRNAASATKELVGVAQDQMRIAEAGLEHMRYEAKAAQEPLVVVELEDEQGIQVPHRASSELYYVFVAARLRNYGGHAVVDVSTSPERLTCRVSPLTWPGLLQLALACRLGCASTSATRRPMSGLAHHYRYALGPWVSRSGANGCTS